jgi:hypothetical protein
MFFIYHIISLHCRYMGMLTQVTSLMGPEGASGFEAAVEKLEQLKGLIDMVHNQIKDPEKTTFVCVCIAEFLSLYETERLVQELSKSGIDTHNVVVNQVLFPNKDAEELQEWYDGARPGLPAQARELIGKTLARKRMQDKYLGQIFELYDEFHVVLMPLLDTEVGTTTTTIPTTIPTTTTTTFYYYYFPCHYSYSYYYHLYFLYECKTYIIHLTLITRIPFTIMLLHVGPGLGLIKRILRAAAEPCCCVSRSLVQCV